MRENYGGIGERHLELLRVLADLVGNDPAAVAQMYAAAQRMNLDTHTEWVSNRTGRSF